MAYSQDPTEGVILRSGRTRKESFTSRTYEASMGRVLAVSATPIVMSMLVGFWASLAMQFGNRHDAALHNIVKIGAAVTILLLITAAVVIFMMNRVQTFTLEAGRITVRNASSIVSSNWDDLSVDPVKNRLGVTYVSIHVGGSTRVLSSLFFSNVGEIVALMADRKKAFQKATEL